MALVNYIHRAGLAAVLLLCALQSLTAAPLGSTAATSTSVSQFVRTNGTKFMLGTCPFYFAGANSYDLMNNSIDDATKLLHTLAANHVTVVRMWAFANGNGSGRNFTLTAIENNQLLVYTKSYAAIDRVLLLAAQAGIKVIMVLGNNWDEYGGVSYFTQQLNLTYHLDFFTDPRARQAYQLTTRYLLTRVNNLTGVAYANDPTIMAWELLNEPRAAAAAPVVPPGETGVSSSAKITAWASEMCQFIKQLDPNHMVAVGDEGFYSNPARQGIPYSLGNGVDHSQLIALPCIDFGTVHIYYEQWGISDPHTFGQDWINDHEALAQAAGKPTILEEYGTKGIEARPSVMADWQASAEASGMAGTLLWNARLQPDRFSSDYDSFVFDAPAVGQSLQGLLYPHAARMTSRNVCPVVTATLIGS